MLPPESDQRPATELVTVPDVDSIEQRLARIETMVTELYSMVEVAKPAVQRIATDVQTQGLAGLMGMFMSARKGN